MRRAHSEVTDPEQIRLILSSTAIGRMASIGADGYPYITPVNFVFHEAKIYFHCSREGEKLDNIARDPRVCFEVDIPLAYIDAGGDPGRKACSAHQLYHCVIIRGHARVIADGPLKLAALNALIAKHEPEVGFEPVTEETPAYKACAVVEIQPVFITAKSDLLQNKAPEWREDIARRLKLRNWPGDRAAVEAMGFDPDAI